MVDGVFGEPVTEGNRSERAHNALNNPNAEGKRDNAIAYVREIDHFGNGASTLCCFYNATGETLVFSEYHSWKGQFYDKIPPRVQNGQWGAFLHTKIPIIPGDSTGAVVYRVKKMDDSDSKQLLCWETRWNQLRDNHVYCDILDDAAAPIEWDKVLGILEHSTKQYSATNFGMLTIVATEEDTSPLYEATLTIDAIARLTVGAIPAMIPSSEVDDDSSAPPTIK